MLRPFLPILGLLIALCWTGPLMADIQKARDLMDASKFTEAMAELLPAAQSGNADAEELIGVMYAMGLGVVRDDERAFEWYLRSALRGHPGAQSGVGWYYEIGRGMPAPDLVRGLMWYVLSAIGGDPDARQGRPGGVDREIRRQLAISGDMAFANSRPFHDPFVGGVDFLR